MSVLIITRGLPGSGKSTWARAWVKEHPDARLRLNRDELRRMLHADSDGPTTNGLQENLITRIQHDVARQALRAGTDVVVDDTNLRGRTAADWATLAAVVGAEIQVKDFTDVDVDTVLARNNARRVDTRVPESVIRGMHERYLKGRTLGQPKPRTDATERTPYTAPEGGVKAWIIDIDGTVAIKGDRDIYDGSKAHLDTVNRDVVAVIRHLEQLGHAMVYCSGRSDKHRDVTEAWLTANGLRWDHLFMRAAGDSRRDSIVKYELFNRHIRERFDVQGVFDDRNQVVEMWRDLGLTVFQVADGNF
jgi:predicted kinase